MPQGPGELKFKKGDFLYVTGHEDSEEWYEAYDPPSNLRGMVPVPYFEVVSRKDSITTVPLHAASSIPATHAQSSSSSVSHNTPNFSNSNSNNPSDLASTKSATSNTSQAASSQTSHSRTGQAQLYGVVLYDFVAERSDELQAKAGESIIIIAKSNEEWFVAKPIGRLGGPGLIPVAFIEVRDIGTNKPVENLDEAIRRANVPRVEEWKRLAAEYKASSIPLGKIDDLANVNNAPSVTEQLQSLHLNGQSEYDQQDQPQQQQQQPYFNDQEPFVVSASVERYAFDNDRYWYLVVAKLSNGRFRNLCRYYQDFYDFQINLLDEFPDEAGRTGKIRTLPFMPGPLTYVNDSISSQRRANLDDYVRNLTLMPEYISRSPIVQQLFAIRTGDIETSNPASAMPHPPNRTSNEIGDSPAVSQSSPSNQSSAVSLEQQQYEHQQLQQRLQDHQYENQLQSSQRYYQEQSQEQPHQRQNSQSHLDVQPPESPTSTRSQGSHISHASRPSLRSQTLATENPTVYENIINEETMHSMGSDTVTRGADAEQEKVLRQKVPEMHVKVKVFHEDDLIALRVPNSISFDALSAKIADRLELQGMVLLHKDESSGQLTELKDDNDLSAALGDKQKLVLCAR